MIQKIKDKWQHANGAGKTLIVIGCIFGFMIIGFIVQISRDISNGKAMKKKPPEVKLINPGTEPDVANNNLAQTLNAFINQYNQDKRNAAAQRNEAVNPDEIRRLVQEELAKTTPHLPDTQTDKQNQDNFNKAAAEEGTKMETDAFGKEAESGQFSVPAQGSTENISSSSRIGSVNGRRQVNRKSADDDKNYLPPGTILSYMSLVGVNAPTNLDGSKTENPPMILLAIKGTAILPNNFTMDLSDCFVTASVYGQYSDSRVVGRPDTLSCVRDDGKAVSAKIQGQITGEDGKLGWHGKTVSRLGKDLARMFKAGAAQTVSGTFTGIANGFNINLGSGSSSGNPRTQINLGSAAGQSAAKETGRVFDRMADIMERQANQVFPVVVIEPMRTGEIQLQEGVTLEFSKDVR